MKYLTKGELLLVLGDRADVFTAFMLNPESFGITEPVLTKLKIAKQKLEWTNSINVDLPEIQELMQLLLTVGVFTQENVDAINSTIDRSDNDDYLIIIKAQDDITETNITGAVYNGDSWEVCVDFNNKTKAVTITELFKFSYCPSEEDIKQAIKQKIKQLKSVI